MAAQGAEDPTQALEALLNTEVEGASRHSERSLDAPASVSVFSHAESQALGHVTLGDMLSRLPGVYITSTRGYSALGLHGFNRPGDYNSRLLLSIDGYRVNDPVFDQALPEYEFPILADWIKQVELVSGTASSVYGGNALLGVANVVTLDGVDAPGFSLRSGFGEAGSRRFTGQYGLHEGQTDVFIGAALHELHGETLSAPELESPYAPGGVVRDRDGTRYQSLFMKLRHGKWRAMLGVQSRDKEVPTGPYGSVPGAPGTRFIDAYRFGELRYEGSWSGDWRPTARLSFTRTRYDGRYFYDDEAGGLYSNRDIADADAAGLDVRAHWRGWMNHAVVLGAELRRVDRVEQTNFDETDPPVTYLDRTNRFTQAALYAQDQIRLSERWHATVGARLDHNARYDTELSPRLALVYRPGPSEAFKLLLGRAFRAPSPYERDYEDGGYSQLANPGLQPEHVSSATLAWERAIGNDTRMATRLSRYWMKDLIDYVPLDETVSQYQNVSSGRLTALDVEFEQRRSSGWQWRTALSLADARIGGQRAANSPRWLLDGHWFGPPAPQWLTGIEWRAIGPRRGIGPAESVSTLLRLDGVLRYSYAGRNSLSLKLVNLTDRRNYDVATSENSLRRVPREGRSLWLDWQIGF